MQFKFSANCSVIGIFRVHHPHPFWCIRSRNITGLWNMLSLGRKGQDQAEDNTRKQLYSKHAQKYTFLMW